MNVLLNFSFHFVTSVKMIKQKYKNYKLSLKICLDKLTNWNEFKIKYSFEIALLQK